MDTYTLRMGIIYKGIMAVAIPMNINFYNRFFYVSVKQRDEKLLA